MLLLDWSFMWKKVFQKIRICLHFRIFYWFLKFPLFELWRKWKCALFSTHNDVSWINKEIKPIKFEAVGAICATVSVFARFFIEQSKTWHLKPVCTSAIWSQSLFGWRGWYINLHLIQGFLTLKVTISVSWL